MLELHSRPWADSLRPSLQTLQSSLLGHARRLWDYDLKAWKDGRRAHLVFWGPPGCGKTTLALLLAESQTGVPFRQLSAVRDGMSEIKKAIDSLHGGGLLFIDEIHRLTRPQQDVLLPPLESGSAWLLAATTENPAGVLSPALLSRIRTVRVHPPKPEELEALFRKSFQEYLSTLPSCANQDANKIERINTEWIPCIAKRCDGDVRLGLNLLESLVNAHDAEAERDLVAGQLRAWTSKSHYDFASAMIKSMRGSDPDAALFYAHAALTSGEDPLFLLRRCIIFASEDVGNADPTALRVALDCFEAFEKVGMPEGRYALAQAICYLSSTVKSNRLLVALESVDHWWKEKSENSAQVAPPEQLVLKGHEKYRYPHSYPGSFVREQYLPPQVEALRQRMGAAYIPSDEGIERRLKERLKTLWSK
ncbi:MAG: AAA family ATPase [Betaproteobacteria bacterium]|nr:AAA family ATPase [Betaproteobacteria bacterium]